MKVISFFNSKGGVGKSTSTVNVGKSLADRGRRVLLVDIDPGRSLSISTGLRDIGADELTVYEVLKGEDIVSAIRQLPSEKLYVLPTDLRLSGAEIELYSLKNREFLLRDALKDVDDLFDYVLIDCPPSLGILTLIALTASDEVMIPIKADFLALDGVSVLLDMVNVIRQKTNPNLEIAGMFITFFNGSRNIDKATIEEVERYFPNLMFKTTISQNAALSEAPSKGTNIFSYSKRSKGAKQYEALTDELIEREEK